MTRWDWVFIAAFAAWDDVRNGFFAFLASQDSVTLIVLLVAVWMLKGKKFGLGFGLGGLEKMGLFDGFLQKHGGEPAHSGGKAEKGH